MGGDGGVGWGSGGGGSGEGGGGFIDPTSLKPPGSLKLASQWSAPLVLWTCCSSAQSCYE